MPIIRHKSRSSLMPNYVDSTGSWDGYTQAELAAFEEAFPGFNSSDHLTSVRAWDAWEAARKRGWKNPASVTAQNTSEPK